MRVKLLLNISMLACLSGFDALVDKDDADIVV